MTDTITPEVGKTYLTRDGRKARCICTDRRDGTYPVVCLVDAGGLEVTENYTADGRFSCGRSVHDHDLVSEAPRVVTVNVWVELTPEGRVIDASRFNFHVGSPVNTVVKLSQDVELPNV